MVVAYLEVKILMERLRKKCFPRSLSIETVSWIRYLKQRVLFVLPYCSEVWKRHTPFKCPGIDVFPYQDSPFSAQDSVLQSIMAAFGVRQILNPDRAISSAMGKNPNMGAFPSALDSLFYFDFSVRQPRPRIPREHVGFSSHFCQHPLTVSQDIPSFAVLELNSLRPPPPFVS